MQNTTTELNKVVAAGYAMHEKQDWDATELEFDEDCYVLLKSETECASYVGQLGFKSIADFDANSNYEFSDVIDSIDGKLLYAHGRLYNN